ncbi:MAG: hypothetical protein AAF431_17000 [Pseudomonadota bacterium]
MEKVVAGGGSSCALYTDGTVECWGRNFEGQLGTGSLVHSLIPVSVPGVSTAVDISAGQFTTCVVLANGTVQCWGQAAEIVSIDERADSASPVTIPGISNAIAIGVGLGHVCVILSDDSEVPTQNPVACWGSNFSGQLGNGSNLSSNTPVAVTGITTATQLSMGANHSCALLADSTIRCWGNGARGELGNGGTSSNVPVIVSGLSNVTAIAAGASHTCAAVNNDEVYCWGRNSGGQLGYIGRESDLPIKVNGVSDAHHLGTSSSTSCAITDDGMSEQVLCWGGNQAGVLGIGDSSIAESVLPVAVVNLGTITSLTSYSGHMCALESGDKIKCWGDNEFGSVGNGTSGYSLEPVTVDVDL